MQNTSDGVDRLARVGLIVLDEVHYLGNVDRGSVWEEAIISCHNHIPLLCMSATVSNPEDLGGWITKASLYPQIECKVQVSRLTLPTMLDKTQQIGCRMRAMGI